MLYREQYSDCSVRHFHEKLGEEHEIEISYTWVKRWHVEEEHRGTGETLPGSQVGQSPWV